MEKYWTLPSNYIYISHLGDNGLYFIIPTWPDSIQDSMGSTFQSTNALSRSAPVFTYSYSGPRTMQVTIQLHRDMMDDVNTNVSNAVVPIGEDYTDVFLNALQAIAVPKYNVTNKAVEPPMVAIRFGEEVFIRGIVTGGITVAYTKPLLDNGRYANVSVQFTVSETDPYDATSVAKNGGFRGVTRTLKKGMGLE